jgi:hypothetical protein
MITGWVLYQLIIGGVLAANLQSDTGNKVMEMMVE